MLPNERAALLHHFHLALVPFSVAMCHGATLPKEEYARAAHPKKHVKIGAICKINRVVVQPLADAMVIFSGIHNFDFWQKEEYMSRKFPAVWPEVRPLVKSIKAKRIWTI